MSVYLTMLRRKEEKRIRATLGEEAYEKPRIKFIDKEGQTHFLKLKQGFDNSLLLPEFCVVADGVNYYIQKEYFNFNYDENLADLKSIAVSGSSSDVKHTTFGSLEYGGMKWVGGVLAQNGKIYCSPSSASQILGINPETKTTLLFGDLGTDTLKWAGGVLAPNGKIYCIPRKSPQILEINPETETTLLFGDLGTGADKWVGGVLAPNGKIYCIPSDSPKVLVIDPETKTTLLFGNSPLLTNTSKFSGGFLSSKNNIVGVCYYAGKRLDINPSTNTENNDITIEIAGSAHWEGGVVAPNGKGYYIPSRNKSVYSGNRFGDLGTGTSKWAGGVLAQNGKIYCSPSSSPQILEINPEAETTLLFGDYGTDTVKWKGSVIATNGKIYGVPGRAGQILEIDVNKPIENTSLLCPYFNKY